MLHAGILLRGRERGKRPIISPRTARAGSLHATRSTRGYGPGGAKERPRPRPRECSCPARGDGAVNVPWRTPPGSRASCPRGLDSRPRRYPLGRDARAPGTPVAPIRPPRRCTPRVDSVARNGRGRAAHRPPQCTLRGRGRSSKRMRLRERGCLGFCAQPVQDGSHDQERHSAPDGRDDPEHEAEPRPDHRYLRAELRNLDLRGEPVLPGSKGSHLFPGSEGLLPCGQRGHLLLGGESLLPCGKGSHLLLGGEGLDLGGQCGHLLLGGEGFLAGGKGLDPCGQRGHFFPGRQVLLAGGEGLDPCGQRGHFLPGRQVFLASGQGLDPRGQLGHLFPGGKGLDPRGQLGHLFPGGKGLDPRGQLGHVLLGGELAVEQGDLFVGERLGLHGRHPHLGHALDEPMRIEGDGVGSLHGVIVAASARRVMGIPARFS